MSTLLDEADEIGVEMPEVAMIKELQAQAVTWQERAKEVQTRAAEAGTPLDAVTLEALLVEGDAAASGHLAQWLRVSRGSRCPTNCLLNIVA